MPFTYTAVVEDELTVARLPADQVGLVGVKKHVVAARNGAVFGGGK